MSNSTTPAGGDFFPELKNEPVRNFTETGWGRFPIALNTAGLHPFAFALYVRLSVYCDTGEEIPKIEELAEICKMSVDSAERVLEILVDRKFVTIEGEIWKLNDPTEWQP